MAIIPVYTDPRTNTFALKPSDYEKVRTGYGCPRCLEDFTESSIVTAYEKCPVCGHRIDVDRDFVALPVEWQDYVGRTSREILESG